MEYNVTVAGRRPNAVRVGDISLKTFNTELGEFWIAAAGQTADLVAAANELFDDGSA